MPMITYGTVRYNWNKKTRTSTWFIAYSQLFLLDYCLQDTETIIYFFFLNKFLEKWNHFNIKPYIKLCCFRAHTIPFTLNKKMTNS